MQQWYDGRYYGTCVKFTTSLGRSYQLEADGQAEHADPRAHFSDALGCETILLTADEQVVLLRRSSSVATHGGLHNGPSGHPEPSRAGVEGAAAAEGATAAAEGAAAAAGGAASARGANFADGAGGSADGDGGSSGP